MSIILVEVIPRPDHPFKGQQIDALRDCAQRAVISAMNKYEVRTRHSPDITPVNVMAVVVSASSISTGPTIDAIIRVTAPSRIFDLAGAAQAESEVRAALPASRNFEVLFNVFIR